MALKLDQALVTVVVNGSDVEKAVAELRRELEPYPEARIISLSHSTSPLAGWNGRTTVIAAIEFSPLPAP